MIIWENTYMCETSNIPKSKYFLLSEKEGCSKLAKMLTGPVF